MKIELQPYSYAVDPPLTTTHGEIAWRKGCFLSITDGDITGVGEAAPLPGFGTLGLEAVKQDLERLIRDGSLVALARELEAATAEQVAEAVQALCAECSSSFSQAAVEGAIASRAAQRGGLSLAKWLSAQAAPRVKVNAAPGGEHGSPRKFKLSTANWRSSLDSVAVDYEQDRSRRYRLDANQAWSPKEALEAMRAMAALPVEYVEEPLRELKIGVLRDLAELNIPIAADESLLNPTLRAITSDPALIPVWILKPAALGGVASTWLLAADAGARGHRITVTTFIDSFVGRAQAAALAAAVEGAGFGTGAHGLGTGELIDDGVTDPIDAEGYWLLDQA